MSGKQGKVDEELYTECKTRYAHVLYAMCIFASEESPDYSAQCIRYAISHGSYEALFFQAQSDIEDPECDMGNLLDSLVMAFDATHFPIRGHFYGIILGLALKLQEMDIFQRFIQRALAEKVDVLQYTIRPMLEDDWSRALIYRYLIVADQSPELKVEDLKMVQDALNNDIRDHRIPLSMKIRASLLKNAICSHPIYGVVPSVLEHMNSLCDWGPRM